MENYNKALDYTTGAADSAGTALNKYENSYLKSVGAAQDKFTASFEKLSTTILNSDLLKGAFEGGSKLINILSGIMGLGDGIIVKIGLLIAAGAALKALNLASHFSNLATKATKLMMVLSNPIGAATATGLLAIAAAVAVVGVGVKHVLEQNEKLKESLQDTINKSDENIAKYKDEISSLKALSVKLGESQNDKSKLLSIQGELNKVIGDSNSLLSGEAGAYDIANKKIQARVAELNLLIQAEKDAAIAAKKDLFNKTGEKSKLGTDDFSSVGATIDLNEAIEQLNRFKKVKKEALKMNGNDASLSESDNGGAIGERISRYTAIIENQVQVAKDIFKDTIENQFSDDISRGYINQYISDLIFGGETDLEDIDKKLQEFYPIIEEYNKLKEQALSASNPQEQKSANIAIGNFIEKIEKEYPKCTQVVESLKNAFYSLGVGSTEASTGLGNLTDKISTLTDAFNLLEKAQKEFSDYGIISSETLSAIAKQFPSMEGNIAQYIVGLKTGNQLLSDLSSAYGVDVANYQSSINAKLAIMPEFYNSLNATQKKFIISLADSYGIDLKNVKTIEELKAKVRETALTAWMKKEGNYNYWTLEKAKTELQNLKNTNRVGDRVGVNNKEISDLQSYIDKMQKLDQEINKSVFKPIDFNPEKFSPSSVKSKSEAAEDAKKKQEEALQATRDRFSEELNELKHAKTMGVISEHQYLDRLEALYKNYYDVLGQDAYQYIEEVYEGRKKLVEDAKSALEKLHDTVADMIKQQKEDEKDAHNEKIKQLEKELDAYQKIYDIRKKALEEQKDENDYTKTSAEKKKNVSSLQNEYEKSTLDNSAEGKKRQLELEQDLADARKDLTEYEADQAYKRLEDQIDKEKEAKEAQVESEKSIYQQKIDELDNYLSNATLVSQDAWNQLNGMNSSLYQSLIDYNKNYGDGIDSSVTQRWTAATAALQAYGSTAQAYQTYLNLSNSANNSTPIPYAGGSSPLPSPPSYGGSSSNGGYTGSVAVGGHVKANSSAKIYTGVNGSAYNQYYKKDPRYTVLQTKGDWVQVRQANLSSGVTGWFKKSDLTGYKKGTDNVPYDGLFRTQEEGTEAIMSDGGLITPLGARDIVFNHESSKKLYDFVNNPDDNWFTDKLSSNLKTSSANMPTISNNTSSSNAVEVNFNGDMIIEGNADKSVLENLANNITNKVIKAVNQDYNKRGYTLRPAKSY